MHTGSRYSSACLSALALGIFLTVNAAPAAAQDAQPAAQQPPPDPTKMKWASTAIVGFSKMAGPVETTNFTAQGEVSAANDSRSFSLQADHAYGEFFGQTSADQQHVKFTVRQDLSSHTYFLARPAFERNKIQSIDYQYEELAGIGVWAGGARGRVDFVPVAGFIQQEKNIDEVDGNHFTFGGLQIATVQLTPLWTLSQSFVYMRNTGGGDLTDSRMQAGVSLSGVIKGPLAINISYAAEHDNIIVETAGGSKTTQTLSIGVQLQFPARP